jgi:hypothetical protein
MSKMHPLLKARTDRFQPEQYLRLVDAVLNFAQTGSVTGRQP